MFLLFGFILVKEITTTSLGPQIDDVDMYDPRRLMLAAAVRIDTALAIAALLALSLRRRARSAVVHGS